MKRFLLVLSFLAAIAAGIGVARVQYELDSALNKIDRESAINLSEVVENEKNLTADDKIVNILLIGADKRESWSEAGRSDTVMIATLDMKHKQLKLTSLMRDMWVEIPEHGTHKFNAAYSYGGVSLLYRTIAANFGLKLDGYAVVDFKAFQEVIDAMGGVEIELSQAEYDYLVKAYKRHPEVKDGLQPGKNTMSGAQALAYSRIRQVGRSDFRRTERQRTVIQSMFTDVKGMSMGEIKDLANKMLPNIVTDLSNEQIYSYMFSVLMMGTTKIHQFRIPTDEAHTPEQIGKEKVLVIDLDANVAALNQFIFEEAKEEIKADE